MRFFKLSSFVKWQKKNNISDETIVNAVIEVLSGLVDARLGNDLIKKRIPKTGSGKSGGYRTIMSIFMSQSRLFVMLGYAKNVQENLTASQSKVLNKYVDSLRILSDAQLEQLVKDNSLCEFFLGANDAK